MHRFTAASSPRPPLRQVDAAIYSCPNWLHRITFSGPPAHAAAEIRADVAELTEQRDLTRLLKTSYPVLQQANKSSLTQWIFKQYISPRLTLIFGISLFAAQGFDEPCSQPEWIESQSNQRGVPPTIITAELGAMRRVERRLKGLNWLRVEVEKTA
ncbi:hypothetical protein B0H14DRAFT_2604229 [Mycena olivaceomarginata]|nr:hypothetical protein B0H14DRAFT_2604229 [Mycena olivaceomarginata]